jgi:hypothetical protein
VLLFSNSHVENFIADVAFEAFFGDVFALRRLGQMLIKLRCSEKVRIAILAAGI